MKRVLTNIGCGILYLALCAEMAYVAAGFLNLLD